MSTTQTILDLLRRFESRNVTFMDPAGDWPIVWQRARGNYVWDVEGRKYLDLTAAFGVANAGHTNPVVVRAAQKQLATLVHAMGDVHPHPLKAQLARELSRLTFERWSQKNRCKNEALRTGKTIFCNSGFEAVEAALKTALLATGHKDVIAFEKAYHGLGYGALNTTHRDLFRRPFRTQLARFGHFVPFPTDAKILRLTQSALENAVKKHAVGAVLIEPVQGRGGVNIPTPEFLPWLRKFCDRHGILLVVDEIYTGFGRTGRWFACEHWNVIPDLICLGKALTGGFPLSACVGRADIMDAAWPLSQGEALHTSTFLGHPVGCAMALAQIGEITKRQLPKHSEVLGAKLLEGLSRLKSPPGLQLHARGVGLMAALEIQQANGAPAPMASMHVVKDMLHRGFVLLPEGEHGHILSITPPLTWTPSNVVQSLKALQASLNSVPTATIAS